MEDFEVEFEKLKKLKRLHEDRSDLERLKICVSNLEAIALTAIVDPESTGSISGPRPPKLHIKKNDEFWKELVNILQTTLDKKCKRLDKRMEELTR